MNWNQERQTDRIVRTARAIEKEAELEAAGGDPTVQFFGCFLVAHVLIWTILATWTQPNLPAETLDLLTAGQSPAWGYFDHPPLAVWMMSFVSAIFAPAAWPAYFLAQVCIAVCIWSAWKIGKDFLHPWTAICGAIVLEGCYFFTIGSTAFTSAHLAGCFWALAILSLYHGFQLEHRRYWVMFGLCLGFGMLSHYSTALLFVSMVAFSFLNRQARSCWDTSWPFLAGAIAGVILLPHLWWAWSHSFTTFSAPLEGLGSFSNHGQQSLRFFFSQLMALGPMVLLLIPIIAYFRLDEPNEVEDEEKEFVRQYLVVVTVLPAALMLALAVLAGVQLGSTGLTLWTFAGVVLLLWSDLDENRIAWRKVILHSGAIGGGFAALLVVINFMLPYTTNASEPKDIHFPGRELAHEVREIWHAQGHEMELPIVAGPKHLAQNTRWYYGKWSHPNAYNNLDESQSVGVNDLKLLEQGGIILWTEQLATPSEGSEQEEAHAPEALSLENIIQRFDHPDQPGNLRVLDEPITLAWGKASTNEPLQIRVAIVHPWGAIPPANDVVHSPPATSELEVLSTASTTDNSADVVRTASHVANPMSAPPSRPVLNAQDFQRLGITGSAETPKTNLEQPTVARPLAFPQQDLAEEEEVMPSFLPPRNGE